MDGFEYTVAVLGGGGVGKSALTLRLVLDEFLDGVYEPTIEDLYKLQLKVDDIRATLGILDTAGQEEFCSLQDQWMRDGDGFLIVYSITSLSSLSDARNLHDKILRTKETDKVPIVLVGNKCDLESERQVDFSQGQELAKKWGCTFYETSAKTKMNNIVCFFELVRAIRASRKPAVKQTRKSPCSIL